MTVIVSFLFSFAAHAVEVSLAGTFGQKAVLVINKGAPRTVSIGQTTPEGVRLVALEGDTATVEIAGTKQRIRLGQRLVQQATKEGDELLLTADSRGHFFTQGSINGSHMDFLVDTGASSVALGLSDAKRLGINYKNAPSGMVSTANGMTRVWHVQLDKVEIGPFVLYGVGAAVLAHDMHPALLGMTFLNRMDMVREGNTMKLKQRY